MSGDVYCTVTFCILYIATTVVILPKEGLKAVLVKSELTEICQILCTNCNAVAQIHKGKCFCHSDDVTQVMCLEAQSEKANSIGFVLETVTVKSQSNEIKQRYLPLVVQPRPRRCIGSTLGSRRRIPPRKTPQQIRDELKYRLETIRNLAFLGQMEANSGSPKVGDALKSGNGSDKTESIVGSPLLGGNIIGPVEVMMEPVVEIMQPIGKLVEPLREATQPIGMVVKPIIEAMQPTGTDVDPTRETAKPIVKVIEPIIEAVGKVMEPVREATQPIGMVVKPIIEAMQPNGTDVDPTRETAKPIVKVMEPIIEAVGKVMEPVREATQPIEKVIEPIRVIMQPIEKIVAPVREVILPFRQRILSSSGNQAGNTFGSTGQSETDILANDIMGANKAVDAMEKVIEVFESI